MTNLFHDADTEEAVLGQMVGYGSTCWESLDGTGVFDSVEASHAVKDGLDRIKEIRAESMVEAFRSGMLTPAQLKDLGKRMAESEAKRDGLRLFGKRVVGGGFTFRGRTFYWGTHRSGEARYRWWIRP